ncbi:heavy metal translocating P-type ATPase [Planktothrix paucivesiculata]|uniref:Copper-transporting ATPase SynA n=1 Tax=Planktothrix paucivesiculata PCC 9631 TaxID=671071 RepID=A0A7Z9BKI5_9CYAN|nr:heavy metal translocating P-type ATPase [Planktothrix paucivesiculata]VXD12346.1 putative copper-transporting ATPase SynA [Planktothrix paucivesiculata PCC 9631]
MQLAPKPLTDETLTPPPTETIILDVSGMQCAGCVKAVERQLLQQSGVISVSVNLATEVARVECTANQLNPENLAEILTNTGFPTQLRNLTSSATDKLKALQDRHRQDMGKQIQRIVTCGLLLLLSSIGHLHHFGFPHIHLLSNIWFHWGLATIALLFPARSIIIDGGRSLLNNAPNMNTLVGLGTVTAYLTSFVALLFPQLGWECFFDEPVMLLGFILLGKTLEQHARQRAATAFQSLIALQPTTARLVAPKSQNEGILNSVEIPAEQVKAGEWLQVLPGEKIPVDGEIRFGTTTVDESMLTGESMPILKQIGDDISAGTINQTGVILIEATRTGSDTILAQIVQLVETAQTRKAPIQKLADIVAGYFTYFVMSLAGLTFLFWYGLGTRIWPDVIPLAGIEIATNAPLLLSLKLAIAVLVIACPCALGLATPTAILVGSGMGAERGLLIKGGDILERVHQLNTVVFDKTGTLTTGSPRVTDCITISELSPQQIVQLAATVEQGSNHPISQAILREAKEQNLSLLIGSNFQTEPGLGVSAIIDNQSIFVGNLAGLMEHKINYPETLPEFSGKTLVYVAIEGEVVGLIAMSDPLKDDAQATVKQLQTMGLRVILLTGDRQSVANAIAMELNLNSEDIFAEVRPQGKVNLIQTLQQQNQVVAMVGDGINDAPALAQADIGIGLQTGTDVANETADIVLMRNSLISIVDSIQLSRATFNKIRQNLFWAFGYNILAIPLAAGFLFPQFGILLSPSTAGALMALSSVTVVTNSLLLRRQVKR